MSITHNQRDDEVIGIGVVGAGYWGPKHVRLFHELAGCRVILAADLDEHRLASLRVQYPSIRTTTRYRDLIESRDVNAVVIATPVSTHAALAGEALRAGKHVLVEKPIARFSHEVHELIAVAAREDRVLMVGHTFLYNPAVRALRDLVRNGDLGQVYYIHSQRLNLGLFQRDINVVWDLAPHDISIIMYILGADPIAVSAHGGAYVQHGIEDVAHLGLDFPHGVRAQIHVSWLDPNKVRRATVVGSRKMAVYDDVETLDKIRVYDKGVDAPPHTSSFRDFQLSYRYGDVRIPYIPGIEPLRVECEHFVECIRTGATPLTAGPHGLKVVQVLESAQHSLDHCGRLVPVPMETRDTNGRTHAAGLAHV
jgi:predicted dehydrogenase